MSSTKNLNIQKFLEFQINQCSTHTRKSKMYIYKIVIDFDYFLSKYRT